MPEGIVDDSERRHFLHDMVLGSILPPGHKIYPYLLEKLAVTRPNQVWAMHLTYISMARGFVYLFAVVDWFSRRVLSWRLSITMEAAFCIEAVEEALHRLHRRAQEGGDHHLDGW